MKSTILALTAATAAAFVPATTTPTFSTSLNNDLWGKGGDEKKQEMSKAVPFIPRPKILDGTLAGDVGFE
jgi:hypothetical protein